jgi:hypothetical protein
MCGSTCQAEEQRDKNITYKNPNYTKTKTKWKNKSTSKQNQYNIDKSS